VGCGLGNFVHELKLQGKFAIGLENSTYAVKEAAKKGYPVIALNIGTQQFPFPDNSFDIVHCFTTLEYLKTEKEIIHAMKEMSRVCKHTIIFSARFSNTDRITNHDNHTNRTFDFQTEKFWRTLWKRSANNKKLVIIDDEY
jgi:ubiquinone/menaquinone biosynthesis C-methylase UbiE